MDKKTFYITTTAPYVNAYPHIGFALEIIQADTIARFKRLAGYEVAFGFGTDEHGVKIYRKAVEAKKEPLTYCNEYAAKFDELQKLLNLSVTHFIRTTNPKHIEAAQEFWRRCYRNGDIYKKDYQIKYCVGCELEKTDSELVDDRCPIHPNLEIENYKEENYFFRFSKYQERLLELYKKNPEFVVPKNRLAEITAFIKKGLQDFSVSRLKEKMPWGIDVPGDERHVMYVWFDALVFYISNIGWPKDEKAFLKWWPVVQLAGKDNLRQQSAIWQAMLMSAGLPNSRQVMIHGFITSGGQKMSKSLGNVINPYDLVAKYGIDATRYYLLKEIPALDDGDFSYSRMDEIYNADLANELGNLASRLTNIAEKFSIKSEKQEIPFDKKISEMIDRYEFSRALEYTFKKIKALNKTIDDNAPWKKDFNDIGEIKKWLRELMTIGRLLMPFMPETGEKIVKATSGEVKKILPLFPRLNK